MHLALALTEVLMLDALARLLASTGVNVVARCTCVPDLERCLRAHGPEIALLDTEMGADLEHLVGAARRGIGDGRLVLLAPRLDAGLARESLDLAVDGVVLKCTAATDVVAALERIAAGDAVFPAGWLSAARRAGGAPEEILSPRQLEVLELLAEGLPNDVIAKRLFISRNTVKFHVAAIYQRLGVSNRVQAAHALDGLRAHP
jgi:DNA-binding NarL/FixJ family response regulator